MNSSSSNFSVSTNSSNQTGVPSEPFPGITAFTRTAYIVIAVLAFLGNALVILVFIRDKALLKKTYNILILTLAISDVVTSINLISSPAFIFGDSFPYPTSHFLSEIFCRLIWTRVILFQLIVFSTYVCLALTAERWYAVVRPLKYSHVFSRKRVLGYIGCVWLLSWLTCASAPFEIAYFPTKPPSRRCAWRFIWGGNEARMGVGLVQVFFKMIFPALSMLGLYIHMVVKIKSSTAASAESRAKLRGKITRMVGGASIALIVCWAPSQINYGLAVAGKARLDSVLHHHLTILAFSSSCLNPVIYGFSNKNYRQGYLKVLSSLVLWVVAKRNNIVATAMVTDGSQGETGTASIEVVDTSGRGTEMRERGQDDNEPRQ